MRFGRIDHLIAAAAIFTRLSIGNNAVSQLVELDPLAIEVDEAQVPARGRELAVEVERLFEQ
jgi:hypothetical protein